VSEANLPDSDSSEIGGKNEQTLGDISQVTEKNQLRIESVEIVNDC